MTRTLDDPALEALDDLCAALTECISDAERLLERAETIRTQRAEGLPYSQIVDTDAQPLIVEGLTAMLARLSDTGSRWRRAEARALHDEGLSMERIAELFGVTRQRVSSLLRHAADREAAGLRSRRQL
jgi:hypothetical protein